MTARNSIQQSYLLDMQKKKDNNEGFPRQTKSEGTITTIPAIIRNVFTEVFYHNEKARVRKTLKKEFCSM